MPDRATRILMLLGCMAILPGCDRADDPLARDPDRSARPDPVPPKLTPALLVGEWRAPRSGELREIIVRLDCEGAGQLIEVPHTGNPQAFPIRYQVDTTANILKIHCNRIEGAARLTSTGQLDFRAGAYHLLLTRSAK
jgi:hypothetical protein